MSDKIGYACLHEAKVQAFKHPIVDFPIAFRGGPVLEESNLQHLRHFRGDSTYDHFEQGAEYPDRLDGEYIYAGPLFDHFGHFMSEMVHRIIPAHVRGMKLPFLFVTSDTNGTALDLSGVAPFVRDVLGFLKIDASNARVIDRNTIVSKLHVFEAGARLAGRAKPAYLEEVAAYSTARLDCLFPDTPRPRALYVSRSALPKLGAILGEGYLESAMAAEGFTVYRPELDPFTVQMDHYQKAEIVVFAEGSAAHGTELLGKEMMGHVALIPRSRQSHIFEKVLAPRAKRFTRLDVSRYAGTIKKNPANGAPLFHRGATLLRPWRLKRAFSASGLGELKRLSAVGYSRAALRDLGRYLDEALKTTEPFSWKYAIKMAWSVPFGFLGTNDIDSHRR